MSLNFSTTNSSLSSEPVVCQLSVLNLSFGSIIGIIRTLLPLPLSIFVIYSGTQRWREKRSFAAESHSDIFTYNVTALELLWVLGLVCFYSDVIKGELSEMNTVAGFFFNITWYGENIFHVLTCAERYLAVVHPITYRLQKNGQGVKIRNISIGCAWLLCVFVVIMGSFYRSIFMYFVLFSVLISAVVVSFFSFSVLCVLKRSGPGEGEQNKAQADQVKQRAFFTILAVTGALWLWFLGLFLGYGLFTFPLLSPDVSCLVLTGIMMSNLPISLVLPLLYLQRAGKLKFHFWRCTN